MNSKKLSALTTDMIQVIEGVRNTDIRSKGNYQTKYYSRPRASINLVDNIYEAFDSITRNFLQEEGLIEKFTEAYVEDKLINILIDGMVDNLSKEDISKSLASLYNELNNYSKEWLVIVPIFGVTLKDIQKFEIGQVEFFTMDENKLFDLVNNLEKIISTTKHTDEEKKEIVKINQDRLSSMIGKVVSEYKVIAESKRAKERAIQQIRFALEILSFCIPLTSSLNEKVRLGLDGEFYSFNRIIPLLSTNNDAYSINDETVGPLAPFVIDIETIGILKKYKLDYLSNIIKKGASINNFESTLLRSLHWCSSAINQLELENKFLNLITAIETLLTPDDNNPIGTAIAEGIALILETNFHERKKLKQLVKRLYGLRSAVSHGGKKAILNSDYLTLQAITSSLIIELLKLPVNFTSQKELLAWIEEKKLS